MKKLNFIGIIIIIMLCGTEEASTGGSNAITAIIVNALSEEFYRFPGDAEQFEKSSVWICDDRVYWYDEKGALEWISFPEEDMIMYPSGDFRRGRLIKKFALSSVVIDSSGSAALRDHGTRRDEYYEFHQYSEILLRFKKSSRGLKRILSRYRKQREIEEPFSLENFPLDFDNPLLSMPGAKLEYFIDPYGNRLEVDSRFRIIEPEIIKELRVERRQKEFVIVRAAVFFISPLLLVAFLLVLIIPVIRTGVRFAKDEDKYKRNYKSFMISIYKNLRKSLLIIFFISVFLIGFISVNIRIGEIFLPITLFLAVMILMIRAVWN